MNNTALHNQRGAYMVLRELVIALAQANPQAASKGLETAERLREAIVNSRQPEEFLAGMDLEIGALRKALGSAPAT